MERLLTTRWNDVSARYVQRFGMVPPPRPRDLEGVARELRRMTSAINGRTDPRAGAVVDVELGEVVVHEGHAVCRVWAIDAGGRRAREGSVSVPATGPMERLADALLARARAWLTDQRAA